MVVRQIAKKSNSIRATFKSLKDVSTSKVVLQAHTCLNLYNTVCMVYYIAIHRLLRETGSLRTIQHDRGREWMEPERQQEIIDYIYEHLNASCRSVADALGIASHVSKCHDLRKENLQHFVTRQFKD